MSSLLLLNVLGKFLEVDIFIRSLYIVNKKVFLLIKQTIFAYIVHIVHDDLFYI